MENEGLDGVISVSSDWASVEINSEAVLVIHSKSQCKGTHPFVFSVFYTCCGTCRRGKLLVPTSHGPINKPGQNVITLGGILNE